MHILRLVDVMDRTKERRKEQIKKEAESIRSGSHG